MKRDRVYAATAALHLSIIFAICCRDTFTVLSAGQVLWPDAWTRYSSKAQRTSEVLLLRSLVRENPVRQGLFAYLNMAGIENGYGFFAPRVPDAYQLRFELHYKDGSVGSEQLPGDAGVSALRVDSLLDVIGRADDAVVREGIIQLLADRIWEEHGNLERVRVFFETVSSPPWRDFAKGAQNSIEILYTYDVGSETVEAAAPPKQ